MVVCKSAAVLTGLVTGVATGIAGSCSGGSCKVSWTRASVLSVANQIAGEPRNHEKWHGRASRTKHEKFQKKKC